MNKKLLIVLVVVIVLAIVLLVDFKGLFGGSADSGLSKLESEVDQQASNTDESSGSGVDLGAELPDFIE